MPNCVALNQGQRMSTRVKEGGNIELQRGSLLNQSEKRGASKTKGLQERQEGETKGCDKGTVDSACMCAICFRSDSPAVPLEMVQCCERQCCAPNGKAAAAGVTDSLCAVVCSAEGCLSTVCRDCHSACGLCAAPLCGLCSRECAVPECTYLVCPRDQGALIPCDYCNRKYCCMCIAKQQACVGCGEVPRGAVAVVLKNKKRAADNDTTGLLLSSHGSSSYSTSYAGAGVGVIFSVDGGEQSVPSKLIKAQEASDDVQKTEGSDVTAEEDTTTASTTTVSDKDRNRKAKMAIKKKEKERRAKEAKRARAMEKEKEEALAASSGKQASAITITSTNANSANNNSNNNKDTPSTARSAAATAAAAAAVAFANAVVGEQEKEPGTAAAASEGAPAPKDTTVVVSPSLATRNDGNGSSSSTVAPTTPTSVMSVSRDVLLEYIASVLRGERQTSEQEIKAHFAHTEAADAVDFFVEASDHAYDMVVQESAGVLGIDVAELIKDPAPSPSPAPATVPSAAASSLATPSMSTSTHASGSATAAGGSADDGDKNGDGDDDDVMGLVTSTTMQHDVWEARVAAAIDAGDHEELVRVRQETKGTPGTKKLRERAKRALKQLQAKTAEELVKHRETVSLLSGRESGAVPSQAACLQPPSVGIHSPDQLAVLARFTAYPGVLFARFHPDGQVECWLECPAQLVGHVIGTGGGTIRAFQQQSRAWVEVLPQMYVREAEVTARMSRIYIKGQEERAEKAVAMVVRHLQPELVPQGVFHGFSDPYIRSYNTYPNSSGFTHGTTGGGYYDAGAAGSDGHGGGIVHPSYLDSVRQLHRTQPTGTVPGGSGSTSLNGSPLGWGEQSPGAAAASSGGIHRTRAPAAAEWPPLSPHASDGLGLGYDADQYVDGGMSARTEDWPYIVAMLKREGCADVISIFLKEHIRDFYTALLLGEKDFAEVGINIGHRRRILHALKPAHDAFLLEKRTRETEMFMMEQRRQRQQEEAEAALRRQAEERQRQEEEEKRVKQQQQQEQGARDKQDCAICYGKVRGQVRMYPCGCTNFCLPCVTRWWMGKDRRCCNCIKPVESWAVVEKSDV